MQQCASVCLARQLAAVGVIVLMMASPASAEEKIYSVDRDVRSGDDVTIDVPDRKIHRVDVLLRRLHKDQSDCYITAGLKGGDMLEGGKHAQVDRQDLHELTFMGDDRKSRDRDLQVRAHNGDVYIREIVVHFR